MKKFNFTLGLIICCFSISLGQLYEVPFEQKVENSDLILEGVVKSQKQILVNEVPYTLSTIVVLELLKGNLALASEVQVLTLGGKVNGERVFSAHTISLRTGDSGIFFLSKQRREESLSNYYQVYAEKQGYYQEKFNGRTKDLISLFSKFKGRNSFYKKLGLQFNEEGLRIETEENYCLQFRIEPTNTSSVGSSNLLSFSLYVKTIEPIRLQSSSLILNYSTNWFGENVIANGNLSISNGEFNSSYSLNAKDIASDVFQIKIESDAALSGLNYLDDYSELLLCTFTVNIQSYNNEVPILIENTRYKSSFYDSDGVLQETNCGEINTESRACNPEITEIDLKKSAGTESVLEIIGSGFIYDDVVPEDGYCGLPNDEHRVKFTDFNGGWIAPLEGDYLEWTDTKIRVKVPTEGYENNSFRRTDFAMDEIAVTGKIRVCINDNIFPCTCFDTSNQGDNSNEGELYVPFAIPSRDIDSDLNCIETKSTRLFSEAESFEIAFNLDALSSDAKNAFIRALNTWRCAIDINYNLNSGGNIVDFGIVPAGLFAVTNIALGDCPDGEKLVKPCSILFDSSRSWHFGISNPPNNNIDFESIALHEIGHAIGLLHTNNSDNVMYPKGDETINKRNLTMDDLEGGSFNQAKSLTPVNCGSNLDALTTNCEIILSNNNLLMNQEIDLFPNPFSDMINLKSEETIKRIQIYNLEGNVIFEENDINSNNFKINVNNIINGAYFIKVFTKNNIESLKIIKT